MSSKLKRSLVLYSGGRIKRRGTKNTYSETSPTSKKGNQDNSKEFDFAEIKKKARNPFSKTANDTEGGA